MVFITFRITSLTATITSNDAENHGFVKCWDIFVTYLQFANAFITSCMVSMIQFLNRKSRDHRYVIQALEKEKKTLKVNIKK